MLPGSTQTETEWVIPKSALHSSLVPSADNTAESLLASLIWKILESEVLSQAGFEANLVQNIAIVSDRDTLEEDFDTGETSLVRDVTCRLRQPYQLPAFDAANY